MVMSAAEHEPLKRRDRLVLPCAELPDRVLERIAQAEVPAECAHLDHELSKEGMS